MQIKNGKVARAALVCGALVVSGAASAQGTPVDVSTVTAAIAAAGVAGATIGLAYLGMKAGIALYKWVRSAM